ncbi:MAG: HAMP domain-containing protein [Clostridia bacterium]|nr:HAMP domain-containing protein [Clostridia bacterium]
MRKKNHTSIGRKIRQGSLFIIISLLFVTSTVIAVSVYFNKRYSENVYIITRASNIQRDLKQFTESAGKLLISKRTNIKTEFGDIKSNTDTALLFISQHMDADNDESKKNSDSIQSLFKAYSKSVNIISAKNTGTRTFVSEYANLKKINGFIAEEIQQLINNQSAYSESMMKKVNLQFSIILVAALLLITFIIIRSLLYSLKLSGSLLTGLKNLTDAAAVIAGGDLTGKDIVIHSEDEIKSLADAFNDMKNNLKTITKRINEIGFSVYSVGINLNKDILKNAEVSSQISQAVGEIAQGADRQMWEIRNMSESVEEMFNKVSIVNGALKMIQAGEPKVQEALDRTLSGMEEFLQDFARINQAGRKITDITGNFAANSEEIAAAVEEQSIHFKQMVITSKKLDTYYRGLGELIENVKIVE